MGVAQTEDRRLRVLELWRLLELLSTQQVPRKGRTETSQVVDWTSDKPLPWDTVHAVWRDGARLTWRHIVYLGVYAIDDTHEILRPMPSHAPPPSCACPPSVPRRRPRSRPEGL